MTIKKTFSALAIIPARGGSKGLPGKNIRPLGGRPLIAWTVEAALRSRHLDRVIVSTDDAAIGLAATAAGAEMPFLRPANLATDSASSIEVVLHALDTLDGAPDYVVLLQPTSPFRSAEDIDVCIERCKDGAPACVSLSALEKPVEWIYKIDAAGRLVPAVSTKKTESRRQDFGQTYVTNGAVYVADVKWLRSSRSFIRPETVAYIMPTERSLDIDTAYQFDLAEYLAERYGGIVN